MSTSQRTTGVVAVVVVLGSLLGLAVWGTLTRASTPAPREPGAPALSGVPSGPGPSSEPLPASSSPSGSPSASVSGPTVSWDRVDYPVDCGGLRVLVMRVVAGVVAGRSGAVDVVEVRCDAGAGSPPSAVLVYQPPASASAAPRLLGPLLTTDDDVLVTAVRFVSGRIEVAGTAYSGPTVPRCCPDRTFRSTWTWSGTAFVQV